MYDVQSPIVCSNLAYNNLSGEIPVQLLQVAQYEYGTRNIVIYYNRL